MDSPETKFYNDIRSHTAKPPGPWWTTTRIESSTVPGIPDMHVVSYMFGKDSNDIISQDMWVELKAQRANNIRVRPSQWAWLLNRSMYGTTPCFVLNRHPLTKKIDMWRITEKTKVERKSLDRIAIIDLPTYTFKSISELISENPTRFKQI